MSILFACQCGVNLRTKDELAGQPGECPNCARHLTIPIPREWQSQVPQTLAPQPQVPQPHVAQAQVPHAQVPQPAMANDPLLAVEPAGKLPAVSPMKKTRRSPNLTTVVTITSAVFIVGLVGFWSYFQFFAKGSRPGEESSELSIQWYTADSLPKLDRQAPDVKVSAEDREKGITFVVVESDVPLTLVGEPSSDNEYKIDLSDCELKLKGDSTAPRGGIRVAAGFAAASRITVTTKVDAKARKVSFGVFFLVKRDMIDKGGMIFRYKDDSAITLTKKNSR